MAILFLFYCNKLSGKNIIFMSYIFPPNICDQPETTLQQRGNNHYFNRIKFNIVFVVVIFSSNNEVSCKTYLLKTNIWLKGPL